MMTARVLILCADDNTARRRPLVKQHAVIRRALPQSVIPEYYFVGQNLNECQGHCRRAMVQDLAQIFPPDFFDLVISEFCPVNLSISILNAEFFRGVKTVIKPGGKLLLPYHPEFSMTVDGEPCALPRCAADFSRHGFNLVAVDRSDYTWYLILITKTASSDFHRG
ncbi:MAG: DEAD/DEAH box helicase family protein [Sulfobacillus sp.]